MLCRSRAARRRWPHAALERRYRKPFRRLVVAGSPSAVCDCPAAFGADRSVLACAFRPLA
eukprot:7142966-Alexandrium_andersonii.AAC.1